LQGGSRCLKFGELGVAGKFASVVLHTKFVGMR
jgi:hypothetical protein